MAGLEIGDTRVSTCDIQSHFNSPMLSRLALHLNSVDGNPFGTAKPNGKVDGEDVSSFLLAYFSISGPLQKKN